MPGGLRLAEWSAGRLAPRAPVMAVADLPALVEGARAGGALDERAAEALDEALSAHGSGVAARHAEGSSPEHRDDECAHGASPGRSGELRDELRVERLDGARARIARWLLRPGRGWELLDAPVMLPAERLEEALRDAGSRGVLD